MRISLNWINDYVDIRDMDIDILAEKFTTTTAEIEEVHNVENDIIFEIDNKSLTNRPDLWCHYGIAREISAITNRKLKNIDYIAEKDLNANSKSSLNVEVKAKEKCLRYSAIKISEIKASASPSFIAERLTNCGIRTINTIIDLANYVMLDIGQPLHTFDGRSIDNIRIEALQQQIKFITLDEAEREVPKEALMISSDEMPLAIAGIMGGYASSIKEDTDTIILESAVFDGVSIRKTSSAMGLRTDASIRYEKFLDASITTMAIGRFLRLLQQYQPKAVVDTALYDSIISPVKPIEIDIEHRYIETYLGNSIERAMVINILQSLEFEVRVQEEKYIVKVPTFRATKDVTSKADIIEEVLRVYGYDKIISKPNKVEMAATEKNTILELEYHIKDLLVKKFDFNEVHSYSWYDSNWLKKLNIDYYDTLKIANSGITQCENLRSDLMPNILKIIYDNRKSYEEVSVFEIGRIFILNNGELTQHKHLTAAVYTNRNIQKAYRSIKGLCSHLLSSVKNIEVKYVEAKKENKKNCLSIMYNDIELGHIYSIPSNMQKIFSSKHTINILDINLELLNVIPRKEIRFEEVSKYPETYLDFSILTVDNTPYSDIEEAVSCYKHHLVKDVMYIDTYIGDNIPHNAKSTTIRIIVGDKSRTLLIEEINEIKEQFIKHLRNNNLQLR